MRARSSRSIILLLLAAVLVWPVTARGATVEERFVTMSDGVKVFIAVRFPDGYTPGQQWPALFEMDGYSGAAWPESDTLTYSDKYITVKASIRGTGCSGGNFDLFSQRSAQDGYEIIENWIVEQSWSNGRVGITGHSYPGLTGFYVAATNPPHLKAVAVSGLVDDYYRGILRPGGILNYGFPVLWVTFARPYAETSTHTTRYVQAATRSRNPDCFGNAVRRTPTNLVDPVTLAQILAQNQDAPGTWAREHSLYQVAGQIQIPIHLSHMYEDDDTGPSAPGLWESLDPDIPKRLVMSNGEHSTNLAINPDRFAWLDCWVILEGVGCPGDILDPSARVRIHFETLKPPPGSPFGAALFNEPLVTSDFPLPETVWRRLYLGADGTLTPSVPAASGSDTYEPTSVAWNHEYWSGEMPSEVGGALRAVPQFLSYTIPLTEDVAFAGPLVVTLHASTTPPDTDFYVEVSDLRQGTPGSYRRQMLQRGMLRASHRAVDDSRSNRVRSGPYEGLVYRPYHPHVDPSPVVPGQINEYQIEIPTAGHVFRAGHALQLRIMAPEYADPIFPDYQYEPTMAGPVTIHHGADHPSNVLVPLLPAIPPINGTPPTCYELIGIACAVG